MSVNTPDSTESDIPRNPEADLALIKEMMMAGRQKMGVDGIHLVIWGFLLSVAFAAQYLSVVGTLPPTLFGIWVPTYILGMAASYFARRKQPRFSNEHNLTLKVYATSWNITGASIGLYFISSVLAGTFDHMTITFLTTALIGGAFMVTSAITGLKKLRYVAIGWWSLLVFFAVFDDIGPAITLILSIACIVLILIPGYFLHRTLGPKG